MRAALLAVVLLVSCDTRKSEEAAVRWTATQIDLHREQADKALAKKADPTYPCAAVRQALEELAGSHSSLARDAVKQPRASCRAALLAFAAERIAAIGKLRRAPTGECVDLDRAVQLLVAIALPGDTEAVALERRRKALCP